MDHTGTWLKLLTRILWSKKFRSLPDNDHRMCYVGHLIVQKLGLENEPFGFLAALFFVSKKRYSVIRKRLVADGLLNEAGIANGFEDSQLAPAALRQRRKRERDKGVTVTRDCHVTCHRDSRKQISEEEGETRARTRSKRKASGAVVEPPESPPAAGAKTQDQDDDPLATPRQVAFVRRLLRANGTTLEDWVATQPTIVGVLRDSHVDAIRAAFSGAAANTPEARAAKEKTALVEKNRRLASLRTTLRSGFAQQPDADWRSWVADQDEAFRFALLATLVEIETGGGA